MIFAYFLSPLSIFYIFFIYGDVNNKIAPRHIHTQLLPKTKQASTNHTGLKAPCIIPNGSLAFLMIFMAAFQKNPSSTYRISPVYQTTNGSRVSCCNYEQLI